MKPLSLTTESSVSPEAITKLNRLTGKLLASASSLILLALLFAPAQAQTKDALWQTYMDAAWKADARSNYAEADKLNKYAEAEKLYKLAQVRGNAFGELDERRIFTLGRLASLYLKWEGRDADAEPLYKQIITLLDKGAGADSLLNAARVSSLAQVYQDTKKFKEAEQLHLRAVAIYRKGMKPGDMRITNYLFNLGVNLFLQGKQAEAEKIFRENVQILERDQVLRGEMISAYSLGILGFILKDQKKYEDAENFLARSLEVVEKLRGKNHPETASFLKAISITLTAQEKFAAAETNLKRSISINESVYGEMSQQVESDVSFLGTVYNKQGRYDAAETQYLRAFDILDKIRRVDASEVDFLASKLSELHIKQRDYVGAEAMCQRERSLLERNFPASAEHKLLANGCFENTYFLSGNYAVEAVTLNNSVVLAEKMGDKWEENLASKLTTLGGSYVRQQRYEQALAAFERAQKIYAKKSLPATIPLLHGLARLYFFQGKYAESESLFLKGIDLLEQKKDAGSVSNAAWFKKSYALLLYAQGKTAQADEMFQKSIEVFKTDKEGGERDMAWSWHDLAMIFTAQGKYADAERLFQQVKALREKVLGAEHADLATTLEGYAALLKKTGRTDEALPLERQAQAIRAKYSTR
ncbi:MAG TPA: tetratricopeptide repeat protein [Pyrinomonadaceae bacterium]|nr:tetratricopeptide repeat protein [Pyrinomonadaceae bacterium]